MKRQKNLSKISEVELTMPATDHEAKKRIDARWLLWIWCVMWAINIPSTAACWWAPISVGILPQGDININYGEPLEIFCVARGNYSSSDIQFFGLRKIIESEVVNTTTRRLYIEKPEEQFSTYYCENNRDHKICTTRVIVSRPPADVTDFKCLSKNLETLKCSWTEPNTFSRIDYKLTFSMKNFIMQPFCTASRIDSTRYCVWNTTSHPRYRQMEGELHFHLFACTALGCHNQNFTVNHFAIVKPNRPYDLQVLKTDAHSALLKWVLPNNIIEFMSCGVDHIIQYQISKLDNGTYFRIVNTSHLPAINKTYTFNLTDLPYAYMEYELRISIKSKQATEKELWSEYQYVVFTTGSEIPEKPPNVAVGAFDQSIDTNKRIVNVYWKTIEELEKRGPDFGYKILVSQNNRTQTMDVDGSMNHAKFNATLEALDVTVWSFNVNGSSLAGSHIYIPSAQNTHLLKVASLTKLAYENGSYELSWIGVENIDNYTLFWCKHNGNHKCVGQINFTVLDPKLTRVIVDLPFEYRYQFAISANKGADSGGMTWATIYGTRVHNDAAFRLSLFESSYS